MSVFGFPGIGGSLGKCAVCGEAFALEVLTNESIPTFYITGISQQLCAHKKCMETLETCKGENWTKLPEGPLRKVFAESNAGVSDEQGL